MSNQLTIVVGAGASKDCVAEGTITEFDDNWRPPLASELFDSRAQFNSILKNYPKARALSEEIRVRLRANGNLEAILRELQDSGNFQVRKQVLEIPLYFQELLWTISDRFITSGGSKFDTFIRRVLTSSFDRVMFLTLNYDLFLEKALSVFADREFAHITDYLPTDTNWALIKVHGSVNWARWVLNNIPAEVNVNEFISRLSGPLELTGEILVIRGSNGLDGFARNGRYRGDRYLYPLIALPAEGPKPFLCPEGQVNEALAFIQKCENFLFIGFSGLDEDVLNLLVDARNVKRNMVVCRDKDSARLTFERIRKRNDRLLPASYGNVDRCLYEFGFRSFVESETFQNFLAGTQ